MYVYTRIYLNTDIHGHVHINYFFSKNKYMITLVNNKHEYLGREEGLIGWSNAHDVEQRILESVRQNIIITSLVIIDNLRESYFWV